MKGGIYSEQRCPLCGSKFKDNGRTGLLCPSHPDQRASRFRVRFGKLGINRRFESYKEAQRFLTGVRFKYDEGSFDIRDYQKDSPLGFQTLTEKWIRIKEQEVVHGSYRNIENAVKRAVAAWGNRNVKEIGYAEIEDFLRDLKLEKTGKPVSDKTRANMRAALHNFWVWLCKRRVLKPQQMPEFPEARFDLGYRKTIDKPTQMAVLDELYRISYASDPKIWLAVKWLCTYIAIRPGELRQVKEKDIDVEAGYITITKPKEGGLKHVPMRSEDVELVKQMQRGFPEASFFRHPAGVKHCREGQRYGKKWIYSWWKRACRNLGIEGVDLYAGTRHSSARALRATRTPEEIKRATMHTTNTAFERYYKMEADDLRDIYDDTCTTAPKSGKTIKFKQ